MVLRVASVPSGHVYVRHLSMGPSDLVRRLPDPPPGAGLPATRWWPPRMLEPHWVRTHAAEFDLMHIHFGFDAVSPERLAELVRTLRAADKPLVLTVHDLRNPHHLEPEVHDAQLTVLVEGADALITLTPGAAAEIGRGWGREAHVLPHPHVVDEDSLRRPRTPRTAFVVGIHAKSLRANMDPLFDVESLVDLVAGLTDARLQVNAHTDLMTSGHDRHDPVLAGRLLQLAADGLVDLRVHDYLSDEELWDYLQGLDVSVLPYRFGTHSGWLEACYDLGTTVVTPDCGFYAEQRPCLTFPAGPDHTRREGLRRAVLTAYQERPGWRADPGERTVERALLARRHQKIYTEALSRSVSCTS